MMNAMTMDVQELKSRLNQGEDLQVIDVREPEEWAIGHLPQAVLIPLGEFAQRGPEEIASNRPVVLYCHHGMRSAQAQGYLLSQGFEQVLNLTGGIDRWSLEVDPSVPRY